MKPLYDFIVHIPKLFNEEIEVGGLSLIKDTRFDDFEGRVPYGEIKATPQKWETKAEVGDTLVFHHHISQQPEKFGLGDDNYLVGFAPHDYQGQSYAAITADGEVKMLGDWIFLEAHPEEAKEKTSASGIIVALASTDNHEPEARVYCEGEGTESLGIKKGELVRYSKNSDYRIKLPNGDEVYRCKPQDILFAYVEE